ncbi:MAG: hypothetical protein C5B51_21945 [Terriglobia bacterium]|nr:MAG: hypothetical protein C5B51_21945 [Terriglobia bacterium]
MKRCLAILGILTGIAPAHDVITTSITFDREIARIFQARCLSCHREGGLAFSLKTYSEARPWAEAIKEEVLARTMPPWGAIKGFGDFRNDQALTPEQIEVIESWASGGAPEGEPADLPPATPAAEPLPAARPHGALEISGDWKLDRAFIVDGLLPVSVPEKASLQVIAEFPDGSVEPLIWLQDYKPRFAHLFLLRTPLELPANTVIRGVPADARLALLPLSGDTPASAQSTAESK